MSQLPASIGVDVGGTKILAGLVDSSGCHRDLRRRATRPQFLLEDLAAAVAEVWDEAENEGASVLGIGVGMRGFVDAKAGRLIRSMTLGVSDLPVADYLSDRFGVPVQVENDVHASTMGEIEFGLGRLHRDFIVFNAGTGISAGLVSNGRLHVGAGGMAGEIGHMSVLADFPHACVCGRTGCIEDLIVRSRRGEKIVLPADDLAAGLPLEHRLLAIGLINLVNAFNPSAIACVGGMFFGDLTTVQNIGDVVRQACLRSAASTLREIVPAFGGYEAGLIGAGALPFLQQRLATQTNQEEAHVQTERLYT